MKPIAIVGDFVPGFLPQSTIHDSVKHTGKTVAMKWVSTLDCETMTPGEFAEFSGFWIAPGSPYKSIQGALAAIRFAREHDIPTLGTCGGFQHLVLEFARHVLDIRDAQHAEYDPYASKLFITKLECSLVGQKLPVLIKSGSLARTIYAKSQSIEEYYCNFGVNPNYVANLEAGGLQVTGCDSDGEVRIIELPTNRFYVGTLFVPQTYSSSKTPHPLIAAFIEATLASVKH